MCRIGAASSKKLPGCHSLQTRGLQNCCHHAVANCNPLSSITITRLAVSSCHPFARPSAAMCEDDSSSTRSWSELPVSVLAFAFEKVELRDRMCCIARVCTSWAAAAAAATTSIELSRCTHTDSLQQWLRSRGSHVINIILRSSVGVITSLPCPRLEWLVLENIRVGLRPGSQLLQDLCAATALQHLHLGRIGLQDEGMQSVCKLTQLHSLELYRMVMVTAAGLAGLHNLPALKRLGLEDLSCEISASAVPAFTQLTALTCLKLGWAMYSSPQQFDPSVLAHMTQLEELHLHKLKPTGGASGAAELLARLAQLTKLQVLHLVDVYCLVRCPPAAFSSLTSSSVLRSLIWSDWNQPGPWQHVFPDRLRLCPLTELEAAHGPRWKAPDLDRLASSCSRLQKLSLYWTPGLQLTALLQLTDLVQLWLRGEFDSSTMASLAHLSGLHRLQRLAVTDACRFSSKLFMPLTALTQLTYLALPHYSEGGSSMKQLLLELHGRPLLAVDRWPKMPCAVIRSTAPAGALPDVWSQLLSCCEGCAAQATQQHTTALNMRSRRRMSQLLGLGRQA